MKCYFLLNLCATSPFEYWRKHSLTSIKKRKLKPQLNRIFSLAWIILDLFWLAPSHSRKGNYTDKSLARIHTKYHLFRPLSLRNQRVCLLYKWIENNKYLCCQENFNELHVGHGRLAYVSLLSSKTQPVSHTVTDRRPIGLVGFPPRNCEGANQNRARIIQQNKKSLLSWSTISKGKWDTDLPWISDDVHVCLFIIPTCETERDFIL